MVVVDHRLTGAAAAADGLEGLAGRAHPGGDHDCGFPGVVGQAGLADVGMDTDAVAGDQGAVVVGESVVEPLIMVVLATEGSGGCSEDDFDGGERKHFERDALEYPGLGETDGALGRGGEDALAMVGTSGGLKCGCCRGAGSAKSVGPRVGSSR